MSDAWWPLTRSRAYWDAKRDAEIASLRSQLDAETKVHLESEAQSMALVIGLKDRIDALTRAAQNVGV